MGSEMVRRCLLVAGLLIGVQVNHALCVDNDAGKNWGNFRGPQHCGFSATAKPPTKWSASENIKWKTAIPGRGSSSPVVWGDKLFLTTAVNLSPNANPPQRRRRRGPVDLKEHQFVVLCIDRNTGKLEWEKTVSQRKPTDGHHPDSGYASASPVTDGEFVYFNFGSMGLYCFDLEGKSVWKRTDLGTMKMRGSFGEGSSVALSEELVIVPWDHEGQSKIEALDRKTGKTVWKQERDEPSNWATPVIVNVDGKRQIIHSGEKFSRGYDLESGKEIWRSSGLSTRPVSTPVAKGNIGFFASSRRGFALNAYYLDKQGDISAEPAWKIDRQTPDCPSLLLSGNRLFYVTANQGIVSCANCEDGSVFFGPERLSGLRGIYSSPVAANGYVYITGRGGKTVVLKDGEAFDAIRTNDIGEPVDATLALVGEQIFIRGSKHLYCVQASSDR